MGMVQTQRLLNTLSRTRNIFEASLDLNWAIPDRLCPHMSMLRMQKVCHSLAILLFLPGNPD